MFLQWENGSTPTGEVKRFVRYGKIRYFEKTENGSVEISKSQYNERNGANVENTDRRAEREIGKANDYDGSAQRGTLGDSDGHRNAGGNVAVFGQTIREELQHDTAGGTSSTLGHNSRNDINSSVLFEEAPDDSGASSFIPNNNDVQYSLTDNTGKTHIDRDALSTMRLDAPNKEEIAPTMPITADDMISAIMNKEAELRGYHQMDAPIEENATPFTEDNALGDLPVRENLVTVNNADDGVFFDADVLSVVQGYESILPKQER